MTTRAVPALGPERRFLPLEACEIRTDDATDEIRFTGHAAVFGRRTWIGPKKWGFWEEVRAGAFAKTIREADIRMLKNHDPNFELARSTIAAGPGALVLSEDETGLRDDATWIPTTYARDLAISVRSGVVNQQSFSFLPVKEEWATDEQGDDIRTLVEVQLFDVSPVTFPAYVETDASMRSARLGMLLEAAGLQDSDNLALVRSIRTGTVTPDLAPVIRAAAQALEELAQRCEPAEATRTQDPLAVKSDHIRLRMRGLAALGADLSKGVRIP